MITLVCSQQQPDGLNSLQMYGRLLQQFIMHFNHNWMWSGFLGIYDPQLQVGKTQYFLFQPACWYWSILYNYWWLTFMPKRCPKWWNKILSGPRKRQASENLLCSMKLKLQSNNKSQGRLKKQKAMWRDCNAILVGKRVDWWLPNFSCYILTGWKDAEEIVNKFWDRSCQCIQASSYKLPGAQFLYT